MFPNWHALKTDETVCFNKRYIHKKIAMFTFLKCFYRFVFRERSNKIICVQIIQPFHYYNRHI